MNRFRIVGDNANYTTQAQCLKCKEEFPLIYNMAFCPMCGVAWEAFNVTRFHDVPRWAYERWGNKVPYEIKLYSGPDPYRRDELIIEWKLRGHDNWKREYCPQDYESALEAWNREAVPTFCPVEYRLRIRDKVILYRSMEAENNLGRFALAVLTPTRDHPDRGD